jgi:hypothetical protein
MDRAKLGVQPSGRVTFGRRAIALLRLLLAGTGDRPHKSPLTLMQKQVDAVQQFTALRAALIRERDAIRQRLQQIDAALAGVGKIAAPAVPKKSRLRSGGRRRAGNTMNIREAITKVTAAKPLSVREIVGAVQKTGYKFTSTNPVNSVGAYLYGTHGKKHFKRVDGKFAPAR